MNQVMCGQLGVHRTRHSSFLCRRDGRRPGGQMLFLKTETACSSTINETITASTIGDFGNSDLCTITKLTFSHPAQRPPHIADIYMLGLVRQPQSSCCQLYHQPKKHAENDQLLMKLLIINKIRNMAPFQFLSK